MSQSQILKDRPKTKSGKLLLKPCPFCGGEARILPQDSGYSVDCLICRATIYVFARHGALGWRGAIHHWNMRTNGG